MAKSPNWTPYEDEVLRIHWPAGLPTEQIRALIPHRTVAAITSRAERLQLKRSLPFVKACKRRAGEASAQKRFGRVLWSERMTRRLVMLADEHGIREAARLLGISSGKAAGRLHRIGWRNNKPQQRARTTVNVEQVTIAPTVWGVDRMAALTARAQEMGIGV